MDLVSVIIPTFNRKQMLARCVDSVLRSTYKNFEIIVSDDASTDSINLLMKERYSKIKRIRYIRNRKESLLSITINKAIKISRGTFILILDDDNVIDKNCIKELVSTFKKFRHVGVVGPLALYYSHKNIIMHAGTVRSKFMRRALYPHINEKWRGQIAEGGEVEDFANAFMFKREVLRNTGLWDLLVPFIGEDGDFEARVRKAGYKIIINPKAKTYHDVAYEPNRIYFVRINHMRVYHTMHSKILNEYRYDKLIGKLTFTMSLLLYAAYYIWRITQIKTNLGGKLKILKSLFMGIIDGFRDAILGKEEIPSFGV